MECIYKQEGNSLGVYGNMISNFSSMAFCRKLQCFSMQDVFACTDIKWSNLFSVVLMIWTERTQISMFCEFGLLYRSKPVPGSLPYTCSNK